MLPRLVSIIPFLLVWTPTASATDEPPPKDELPTEARTFLNTYCVKCHQGEKAKAKIDLTQFQTTASMRVDPKVWGTIIARVRDGEMPPVRDRFRAGGANGHIGGNGRVRRTALHQLMAKLTQRIRRSGAATGDNSGVPSGYTYLLQFIAHDMVDSVLTFNIHDPDITPGARNARSEPLRLETLYGAGPDECPQAYEYTSQQVTRGLIPRIRLRLGWRAHRVGRRSVE